MRLSEEQKQLLAAMHNGRFLKSHRDIDGGKQFQLHNTEGRPQMQIRPQSVDTLRQKGLIDSNKKFPVATFWLTERGRAVANRLPWENALTDAQPSP